MWSFSIDVFINQKFTTEDESQHVGSFLAILFPYRKSTASYELDTHSRDHLASDDVDVKLHRLFDRDLSTIGTPGCMGWLLYGKNGARAIEASTVSNTGPELKSTGSVVL